GKGKGTKKDKQGYIPKPKNPIPSAKEHLAKDDACHHCKEVGNCKRNCLAYLAELMKKKKQVGTANSSCIFTIELFSFANKSWGMTLVVDHALKSATRILNMVPTKKVDKTPYELWYRKVPNLSYLKIWGCEALVKRDTPDKL
ncbi:hypothetical protein Tco_0037479, partial [Tanacetum coccineum]